MNTPITIAAIALLSLPLVAQEGGKRTVRGIGEAAAETEKKASDAAVTAEETLAFKIGSTLPITVALPDIDGKLHRAKDFRGKLIVLNFWSTTCPVMQAYEERISTMQADYEEKDVQFVMVNANEANGELDDAVPASDEIKPYQKIRDYLKENEFDRTVLVDRGSIVADMLGAKTTPDIYLFDKEGKLVYRGLIDDDRKGTKAESATHYLRDAIDATLAGDAVDVAETTPQGCIIKRNPMLEKTQATPESTKEKVEPVKDAARKLPGNAKKQGR